MTGDGVRLGDAPAMTVDYGLTDGIPPLLALSYTVSADVLAEMFTNVLERCTILPDYKRGRVLDAAWEVIANYGYVEDVMPNG